MRHGYFTNKDGYPVRPNFGISNNKIISISTMSRNMPLRDISVWCGDDITIEEMEQKDYKFNTIDKVHDYEIEHKEVVRTLTVEQHLDMVNNGLQ